MVRKMDNKDVAIGFTLLIAVVIAMTGNIWYSIIVDLLLLSSYAFVKHMFVMYKTEASYINRMGMKPAYGLLGMSILSYGILRIIYVYADVFSSKQVYSSLPWILKVWFYVDIFFGLIFLYLLIKFFFADFLEFSLPSVERVTEYKEEVKVEEIKEEEVEEKKEEKEEEVEGIKIKKLPVIIVSRG